MYFSRVKCQNCPYLVVAGLLLPRLALLWRRRAAKEHVCAVKNLGRYILQKWKGRVLEADAAAVMTMRVCLLNPSDAVSPPPRQRSWHSKISQVKNSLVLINRPENHQRKCCSVSRRYSLDCRNNLLLRWSARKRRECFCFMSGHQQPGEFRPACVAWESEQATPKLVFDSKPINLKLYLRPYFFNSAGKVRCAVFGSTNKGSFRSEPGFVALILPVFTMSAEHSYRVSHLLGKSTPNLSLAPSSSVLQGDSSQYSVTYYFSNNLILLKRYLLREWSTMKSCSSNNLMLEALFSPSAYALFGIWIKTRSLRSFFVVPIQRSPAQKRTDDDCRIITSKEMPSSMHTNYLYKAQNRNKDRRTLTLER